MTVSELKSYIKEKKIKYKTISEKSGIPLGTLRNIFSNSQNINPRIDTIRKIEQALDIDTTPKFVETYYTAQEERLIQIYRTLSDRDKKMVDNIFNSFVSDVPSKNVRA